MLPATRTAVCANSKEYHAGTFTFFYRQCYSSEPGGAPPVHRSLHTGLLTDASAIEQEARTRHFGAVKSAARAYLLESEATGADGISTPEEWQVEIEPGHRALDRSAVDLHTYFAAGPGEQINAELYDWDWQSASDANANWVSVASPK
jgi:hypothetical protein